MKALRIILASIKKADEEYNLFSSKDKIVIGISGGKDSMVLLYSLALYKNYSHKNFTLIPAIIDLGFPNFQIDNIKNYIKSHLNLDLEVLDGKTVYPILKAQQELQHTPHLPCSICSKMKKAIINKYANKIKANKVSFAHHLDDAIETLFLNEIYGGRIATFTPKMFLENEKITFIRPLIYVKEQTIKKCIKEENILIEKSNCPNDGITKRAEIKNILNSIYNTFEGSHDNFLNILINKEKEDLFYNHYEKSLSDDGLYYKEIDDILSYKKYLSFIKRNLKSYCFSKLFKKKDYLTKYFLIYKNNKIKGAIELNYKERDFVISTIKFISKKEFKLFLFKFYKNLYLRINPVNLYIYTNDASFLNEFNLAKIKKDLYLLNINPIDIEKLLKKSHK